jgi:hypothetical protein
MNWSQNLMLLVTIPQLSREEVRVQQREQRLEDASSKKARNSTSAASSSPETDCTRTSPGREMGM